MIRIFRIIHNVTCPYCGFKAHKLCSQDGKSWKYICERCNSIFVEEE